MLHAKTIFMSPQLRSCGQGRLRTQSQLHDNNARAVHSGKKRLRVWVNTCAVLTASAFVRVWSGLVVLPMDERVNLAPRKRRSALWRQRTRDASVGLLYVGLACQDG